MFVKIVFIAVTFIISDGVGSECDETISSAC